MFAVHLFIKGNFIIFVKGGEVLQFLNLFCINRKKSGFK